MCMQRDGLVRKIAKESRVMCLSWLGGFNTA